MAGPTELYVLLSIIGLFVFSCVCYTCCCNCFGDRRKRRQGPWYSTSDSCYYCIICDSGPTPVPTSNIHADDCDAAQVTVADAPDIHHGFCGGCFGSCCEGQEGCCEGGGDDTGGGCCDCGGDSGGGDAGCCDGGNEGCCDGGDGDCCAGGDAGGADCDCGGGDCDCGGCDC